MIRYLAAALMLVAGSLAADEPPQRLAIAGGDLTEIVFALGSGDRVVAVDQTSTYPPEAGSLPQIGYVRRLSAEGILSLDPDLLLAADDAGPEIVFEQLGAAALTIARAPKTAEVADIADKIRFVGQVLGRELEAEAMADDFARNLAEVKSKVAQLPERLRALFILSIQGGAPLVGGTGTQADQMLTLAGAENVAAGFEGYKPMNHEAILAAQPDVIVMMAQHAARNGGVEAILARPEIALTPAGRNRRAVTMDGMLMLGFGPRTPEAIAELASALQPEAAAALGL
ncbi:ABC transporter substrate-binding protein [Rhodobacteraceae bacterium NNCM2]|nr:ABC transporter substrate-binding protein [Coraliihabitans acroporae]